MALRRSVGIVFVTLVILVTADGVAAAQTVIDTCRKGLMNHRNEVELRLEAFKKEVDRRSRDRQKLCMLMQSVADAQASWITFAEANIVRCDIQRQTIGQEKASRADILADRTRLCAP
jgi:hypothetical protein